MTNSTQRTTIQVVPHFSQLQEWIALDEGFFQEWAVIMLMHK